MVALGGIWRKFIDLLPSSPRQVGSIISTTLAGEYVIQLVGGGMIKARSEQAYQPGDRVFVSGGKVESKANNLPSIVIEV